MKKAEMQIVVFESIDILTTSGNGGSAGHTVLANMSQSAYQMDNNYYVDGHYRLSLFINVYDANGTFISNGSGERGSFYHYQLDSSNQGYTALQECNDESHHAN